MGVLAGSGEHRVEPAGVLRVLAWVWCRQIRLGGPSHFDVSPGGIVRCTSSSDSAGPDSPRLGQRCELCDLRRPLV